ncbi:TRF2-interacting telomeric protein/Rap1 C terminal domain-containing protein [Hypoxylon crocopeplum]|nr:TRF2-interacting telomeric protein/Rap1 C terminal domain-containing protein [Hypoxylon crocopeplum]
MSAPIVYEGVLAPKAPHRNGIFKDKKFWVGQRVPMRHTYIQNIQNNYGQVVPLEKNADYLIFDHVRKDAPSGSLSYKFIEDSIKAGALQNPEEYLCIPTSRQSKVGESRPPSSAGTKKTTRTRFTAEDDSILFGWIAKKERLGEPVSGNTIYKELAAKYPHHTYQSWRDRWVSKLQHLPRPEIESSPSSTGRVAKPPSTPSASLPPSTPGSSSSKARFRFTADDDKILIEHVRDSIRHNRAHQGINIFKDLANDFPQHTYQSWRARWVKHLQPRSQDEIAQWESERLSKLVGSPLGRPPKGGRTRDSTQPLEQQETPSTRKPVGPSPAAQSGNNKGSSSSIHTDKKELAHDVIQVASTDEIGNREHRQQQFPVEVQTTCEEHTPRPKTAPNNLDQSSSSAASMKKHFIKDYQAYAESTELPFIPWHTIRGRTFELWSLWQVVRSQKMDPCERDWQKIAEELGYNWIDDKTIHHEIRECYEAYLARFEEDLEMFDACTEDDDDDEADEDDQDPGTLLPSLLPIVPSLKRPLDALSPSDHAYPQPSPKRQKIDRDAEIPSTPDDVNETSHLRHNASVEETPRARQLIQHTSEDTAEEDESRDTVHDLPTLPLGRKKVPEPETQDFRFDPETQNIVFETQENNDIESQCNITPSQQLHQESDAILPDIENASPTPRAATRATNQTTTPRRAIRYPFLEDSDDEPLSPAVISRDNDASRNDATAKKTKRRSLPKSFTRNTSPSPTTDTPISIRSRGQDQPPASKTPPPLRFSEPVKETPQDVIDRFCSLGYPKKIVLQALRATTWRLGDAGQVMEMLKRGEELPRRAHGVWTRRDDDALKLVYSTEPPKDEKEESRRTRAQKRLEEKHGLELMELRRKYLWETV